MSITIQDPILNIPIKFSFDKLHDIEFDIHEETKQIWHERFNIRQKQTLRNITVFDHIKFVADKYIYKSDCDACHFPNIIKVIKKLINIFKHNFGCIFIYFIFFPIEPIYMKSFLLELFGKDKIKYSFIKSKSSKEIVHIFDI